MIDRAAPVDGVRPYLLILAAFIFSRLAFHWAGVHFLYQSEVVFYAQYADQQQLKDDLLRSILYLHAQPPLFNLLLGVAFKGLEGYWPLAFQWGFLASGLLLSMLLFRLMRLFGVEQWIALAATLIYLCSPSQVLYENLLFYTYPCMVLATMSAWCAMEFFFSRQAYWAHGLLWIFATLCLLRSSYYIVIFFLPFWTIGRVYGVRRAAKIVSLPLLIVLVLYLKNWMVFGFFGSSSWMGMNMAKITLQTLTREQRQDIFALTGDPLAFINPFNNPTNYHGLVAMPDVPSVPILSNPYKSNGSINYNYAAYIPVSRRYEQLAWAIMRRYPYLYLHNVEKALCWAAAPAERNHYMRANIAAIAAYADWYDLLVWLSPYPFIPMVDTNGVYQMLAGLTCLFFFPICVMYWCLRCWHGHYWQYYPERLYGFLYIMALIAYLLIISSLFDIGENNRFRFDWEALMVVLMVSTPFQCRTTTGMPNPSIGSSTKKL